MDASRIIPQGELAKFKIDIKDKNFDIDFDDFTILLSYGMMGESVEIKKSDCIIAADGCYFSFDTSKMIGKVTAVCSYDVVDGDVSGVRRRVDIQMLCFVSPVPCPRFLACPVCGTEEHQVEYTRITESDVTASYELLCDCYGTVFVTRDLMNIYVLAKHPEDNNE
jgi:hypothetical protein